MNELQIRLAGFTEHLSSCGIPERELDGLAEGAKAAFSTIVGLREAGDIGFLDLPDDNAAADACLDYARSLPAEIDTMVVLGIGGSSLGPNALYNALGRPYDSWRGRDSNSPRRLFFPDNPDPVSFQGLLETIDLEKTVFNVVTKSGSTAETAAQFLVVAERLEKALGRERIADHLVATTDPVNGDLRKVVSMLGLQSFPIPPSVGGRFSVLSAVGMLPAAVAGSDVKGLLAGARTMRDACLNSGDIRKNPALLLSALLYLHDAEHGRAMTVVMPYADGLYSIADWFRQLWAESLGKAKGTDGSRKNVGPTPIAARGATDQHSQLQLFAEGPDDKSYIFLNVGERASDVKLKAGRFAELSAYAYLDGKSLGQLLDAEWRGTIASLRKRDRPVAEITFPVVDAKSVGAVLMLLEIATAFAGPLYGVDPFDQPGVENAKQLAYAALGRDGYEGFAGDLKGPGASERYSF